MYVCQVVKEVAGTKERSTREGGNSSGVSLACIRGREEERSGEEEEEEEERSVVSLALLRMTILEY